MQVSIAQRPWFNPDFNGRWFFVPGLIATITLVMLVNLTAFAVVREREVGTLEQIMVSPILPAEFILGKTIPFFVVGLGIAGLVTIVGICGFRIQFSDLEHAAGPAMVLTGQSIALLSHCNQRTFLKGIGLAALWPEFVAMAIIATILLTVSILRFRKSLE